MNNCCGNKNVNINPADPCKPAEIKTCAGTSPCGAPADGPFAWFGNMIPNCLAYAQKAKEQ